MTTELAFLQRYRTWALWTLAVIVVLATTAGQVESFHGLFEWFSTHGLPGIWAAIAPLMVDTFTIIGELAIFVGLTGHWMWHKRILPWVSIVLGLGASIAGNVGDKAGHPVSWQLTASIPPLAAAFGIVIGFSVLKSLATEVSLRSFPPATITVEAEKAADLTETPGIDYDEVKPEIEAPKLWGVDNLIPPRPEPVFEPVPVEKVEAGPAQVDVSREFARGRLPEAKNHGIVGVTGSFPALP